MVNSHGLAVLILKQLLDWIAFQSPTSGKITFRVSFKVLSLELPLIIASFSWRARGVKKCKTPFCFKNMWLQSDGFKELVCVWWTSYSIVGSINHCFAKKLKALKIDLKRWNKEFFCNVSSKKSKALSRIQF